MSQPIALVDLDDTLFQTVGKCPGGTGEGLRLMSRLVDGSPSGYATQPQQNLLSWLRIGKVIPVTARSRDVLARVHIEQAPAICSNGGCVIAPGGAIDQAWHDHLMAQAQTTDPIADVYGMLTADLDKAGYRHWIVDENELPLFIVIKTNGPDHGVLADLSAASADRLPAGWRIHRNGNNLAYLPQWLNKRHAAGYLIEKLRVDEPASPIVGIGDSLSDVGFMDLCDYAMTPTQSQLWRTVTAGNDWIN
ncbi:sucrose-6-phosphate hydrolase [Sphingobium sp. Leaf26]|uniref:hypothetical protein n=1 Tax=Sphingobium sp. Leaf26 TaxID=1735693 RepID=UPI00070211A0|nr:hypothetical protein [Sphingobium sp. Leaf26]KQN09677.1 sucrose-6-phosphate hydrolase [Sphingobium sp. Leaf26]